MPGTVLKESVSVLGPGGKGLTGGQAAGGLTRGLHEQKQRGKCTSEPRRRQLQSACWRRASGQEDVAA